jgi:hypothetical protein
MRQSKTESGERRGGEPGGRGEGGGAGDVSLLPASRLWQRCQGAAAQPRKESLFRDNKINGRGIREPIYCCEMERQNGAATAESE